MMNNQELKEYIESLTDINGNLSVDAVNAIDMECMSDTPEARETIDRWFATPKSLRTRLFADFAGF